MSSRTLWTRLEHVTAKVKDRGREPPITIVGQTDDGRLVVSRGLGTCEVMPKGFTLEDLEKVTCQQQGWVAVNFDPRVVVSPP
jgi:hypothetical protein